MFTKLFSSITDSTIWREPDHVRLVWITMLAKCDKHGIVYASVPGLADAARVSLESCQDALLKLSSPDEWSRSKDDGGRRIHEVDGGWMLINHSKYKKIKDADERREYVRQKVQEHREKHKPVNNDVNNVNNVNTGKPGKHIRSDQIRSDKEEASAEASAMPDLSKKAPYQPRTVLTSMWESSFKEQFGDSYMHGGVKDEVAAKKLMLIKDMTCERVMDIARKAWKKKDSGFYCKMSVTISGFSSKFMEIKQEVGELKASSKRMDFREYSKTEGGNQ